jgi:hypothetical protein
MDSLENEFNTKEQMVANLEDNLLDAFVEVQKF